MMNTQKVSLATSFIPLEFKNKENVLVKREIPILGLGTPSAEVPKGVLVVDCPFTFTPADPTTEHDWHAILTGEAPSAMTNAASALASTAVEKAVEKEKEEEKTKTKKPRAEEKPEEAPAWVANEHYQFDPEDTLSRNPHNATPNAGLRVDEVVALNNQHGTLRNTVDHFYFAIIDLGNKSKDKGSVMKMACVEDLHRWAEKKREASQWSNAILTKIADYLKVIHSELSGDWMNFGPGGKYYVNKDLLGDSPAETVSLPVYLRPNESDPIGHATFKGDELDGLFACHESPDSKDFKLVILYKDGKKKKVYGYEDGNLACLELFEKGRRRERVEFYLRSQYEHELATSSDEVTKLECREILASPNPIIKRALYLLQDSQEGDKKEEKERQVTMFEFNMFGDLIYQGEGLMRKKKEEGEYEVVKSAFGMSFKFVKQCIEPDNFHKTRFNYLRYATVNGSKYKNVKGSKEEKETIYCKDVVCLDKDYHVTMVEHSVKKIVSKQILFSADYYTLHGFKKCSVTMMKNGTTNIVRYTQTPYTNILIRTSSGEVAIMRCFKELEKDLKYMTMNVQTRK